MPSYKATGLVILLLEHFIAVCAREAKRNMDGKLCNPITHYKMYRLVMSYISISNPLYV